MIVASSKKEYQLPFNKNKSQAEETMGRRREIIERTVKRRLALYQSTRYHPTHYSLTMKQVSSTTQL